MSIRTIKHTSLVIGTSVLISMTILFVFARRKGPSYKYDLFRASNGWGYAISMNDSLIIRQDFMPVILTNKPFKNRDQARETAELVVQKLRRNQLPTLTQGEMEKIDAESSSK